MLMLMFDTVVTGPSLDPGSVDVVVVVIFPVVRGPSVVIESGLVKVSSVTEAVLVAPSV